MNEELLKIFDMNEDEQSHWLLEKKLLQCRGVRPSGVPIYESLAELAFRLRNEVRTTSIDKWNNAIHIVASYINESPMPKDAYPTTTEVQWSQIIILNQSEYPVYMCWIIAALIAKEKK